MLAARPTRQKFHTTTVDAHPGRQETGAEPTRHALQVELRQVLRQAQVNIVQREVGGQVAQAAVGKARPGAHGTAAMWQGKRVVEPGTPHRQIGVVDLDKRLTLPGLCLLDTPAAEITAQIDSGGEFGRRHGGQAEAMLSPIVVEGEVDVLENQWRGLALGVLPDHRRPLHPDASLRQYPVRHATVATILADRDPRDIEAAVHVAAQMQGWLGDLQQAQAQLPVRNRRPGENAFDTRKGQCRLPLCIGNAHVGEDQVRIEAGPAGLNLANDNRQPEPDAELALDLGPIALDIRQDEIAQRQHKQNETEIGHPEGAHHEAPDRACHPMRSDGHEPVQAVVERRAQVLLPHQWRPPGTDFCQQTVAVTRISG